jgi:DNA-binding NarL/FixJ family response regulator
MEGVRLGARVDGWRFGHQYRPSPRDLAVTTFDTQLAVVSSEHKQRLLEILERLPETVVVLQGQGFVILADPSSLAHVQLPTRTPSSPAVMQTLTQRDRDILRLVARGLTNREIGAALHLSPGTVRNRVGRLLQKLGVARRTQIAVLAVSLGLADAE